MTPSGSPRVVLLGFDAMDPQLTRAMAAAGHLPAFAELLGSCAQAPIRNPAGLFVGSLWSTFFTARTADRTGFHCWIEVVPETYELRLTSADSIRGVPFWETLSRHGRRVAVLDVPHSRAGTELNGVQVSEWGCHDRHFGLRSYPPELAEQLVLRHGAHPVLGADPLAVREWAPDDYEFRAGPLRSGEEEGELLSALLAGVDAKTELSAEILGREPWDLFISVFGESHSVGHQSWHVRDPTHPRHDPALLKRIGDPLAQVYERMDEALARHLALVDDETTVLVLLSHGMGPHHDGTHLLPEILRRLHAAHRGTVGRSPHGRLLARAWSALPRAMKGPAGRLLGVGLRRRRRGLQLTPARNGETAEERRTQPYFVSPNNFVVGGVRINLRGREPDGVVSSGEEFDRVFAQLRNDLLDLVNVETGAPVVRSVTRTDRYYPRNGDDTLPDLFLEWNRDGPIETVWSPRFGMIHGRYEHWRTGDHKPGGVLLVRSPELDPSARLPELAIEDLGPSIAARLGVELTGVDGVPASWLADGAVTQE